MGLRSSLDFKAYKGGKKHVFYDLQMEVEAAKDDQVSDFFSTRPYYPKETT